MAREPLPRAVLRHLDSHPDADGDEDLPKLRPRVTPACGVAILAVLLVLASMGFATGALAAWVRIAQPLQAMDDYDPPETTTLLDREGRHFARLYEEQRQVVSLADLPAHLPLAFIAIEDTGFRSHIGVDPRGVARATVKNAQRGSMAQGASTITQQLTRNLLPRVGRERTLRRKIHEALIAFQMEHLYSKDQILETYLNQIYLGSGTWGVGAASQLYFGKPASEIELHESALLAGLPQLPERYSPLNDRENARSRRDQVLDRLLRLGWISHDEFAAAIEQPVPSIAGMPYASETAGYFVDAVRAEIHGRAGIDFRELREGGWRIQTTVDPAEQEMAARVLGQGLEEEETHWIAAREERFAEAWNAQSQWPDPPKPGDVAMARVVRRFERSLVVELPGRWRADLPIPVATRTYFSPEAGIVPGAGVDVEILSIESPQTRLWKGRLLPQERLQGALVCLDARTGEIRALAGGRKWSDLDNSGFFNRATAARRQAGSTLKPLFYCAALEAGMTPGSIVLDAPIQFPDGYAPRNYENEFFGPTTLQEALEHSRNVATIRMVQQVGLRRCLQRVHQFENTLASPRWKLPPVFPVVLGTSAITPLEIAAAYQPFANAGQAVAPVAIRQVLSSSGQPISLAPPQSRNLLRPSSHARMLQMLIGVMTHGTGRAVRDALPPELRETVAGKTGTTSDNRDAWFAGFTPEIVVVVWVGFDQPLPLGHHRTGGRVAGPIWARFVTEWWEAQPDKRPRAFELAGGWSLALVDRSTGFAADGPAATAEDSWKAFPPGEAPRQPPALPSDIAHLAGVQPQQ